MLTEEGAFDDVSLALPSEEALEAMMGGITN
jgi:hypothetical protein